MSLMIVHTKLRSPGTEEKLINVDTHEERTDESALLSAQVPRTLSATNTTNTLYVHEYRYIK